MRVFDTLQEAASEIKRDISKSPLMTTQRIQGKKMKEEAHEAMAYLYTVKEIPDTAKELLQIGLDEKLFDEDEAAKLLDWITREQWARSTWHPGGRTEDYHPHLDNILIGQYPGYTYTDRLDGAQRFFHSLLNVDPTSRRGYWPIFQPSDTYQAFHKVRIPCSLGYQLMIRDIAGESHLHMTYLQRSCDFERFWLTDVWLARQFQIEVANDLQIKLGYFTHFILSLHAFTNKEIY